MLPYKIVDGKRQQGVTVFHAPRAKHSQKPLTMRKLIEKVSGRNGFNKVELFARERRLENWDVWGNEVDSDIDIM